MNAATQTTLRSQLLDRRKRLEGALHEAGSASDMVRLLHEVDQALDRMEARTYGTCELCKETVEEDFLEANPLIQYCLCSLTPAQQQFLQNDLDLAGRVQWGLLPRQDLKYAGWHAHFRYEPLGPVSGDYCDLIESANGEQGLRFMIGDVSGKGVAASLLMAHLNALMRTLAQSGLPLAETVDRANRLFGENTLSTSHYITLVSGKASDDGTIEVCNAGHVPPMLLHRSEVVPMNTTGFPVGIVKDGLYQTLRAELEPGDTLVLYTDGLTESVDPNEREYGAERLVEALKQGAGTSPAGLAAHLLQDVHAFRSGASRVDDLTLLILRREA